MEEEKSEEKQDKKIKGRGKRNGKENKKTKKDDEGILVFRFCGEAKRLPDDYLNPAAATKEYLITKIPSSLFVCLSASFP